MVWSGKFFLIFSFIYMTTIIADEEYCSLCTNASHTLCKYPKAGPSKNCINYRDIAFTDELKKYTVDVHNDVRDHVASGKESKGLLGGQPSASNMNMLSWDDELAGIAQRWADQCIPLMESKQHDECRKIVRFDVGQNILTAISRNKDFPDIGILILNWYKQVENIIPSDVTVFSGSTRGKQMIGQYTQLVWAETKYVGCGISTFTRTAAAENVEFLHRLVCNYGPRGNIVGSPIYEKGPPCENCPRSCNTMRLNLCEADEEFVSAINSEIVFKEAPKHLIINSILNAQNLTKLSDLLKNTLVFNSDSLCEDNQINSSDSQFSDNKIVQLKSVFSTSKKPGTNDIAIYIPTQKMEFKFAQIQEVGFLNNVSNLDNEIISLPNNVLLKKEKGTWMNGKCHCRLIYRSSAVRRPPLPIINMWIYFAIVLNKDFL